MPSAVATAVQYDIPAVWVVWNNHGYVSIRDQQRGYFGADREYATTFAHAATGEPYTADNAALARAMGADGVLVEAPGELAGRARGARSPPAARRCSTSTWTREAAPPAPASWDLPPLPNPEPTFGWDPD